VTSHHQIDQGLRNLGLDPDDLDPDVLAGIREAAAKPPRQLDRGDLSRLSAAEIVAAEAAGKLDRLLGRNGEQA
jgi:hypothetical protein